jgi:hypothetical protein
LWEISFPLSDALEAALGVICVHIMDLLGFTWRFGHQYHGALVELKACFVFIGSVKIDMVYKSWYISVYIVGQCQYPSPPLVAAKPVPSYFGFGPPTTFFSDVLHHFFIL